MRFTNRPGRSVHPPKVWRCEGFETLLSVGRRRGYLTQDDLILVLQAVELTHDVIEDVVLRVRGEGIEYVEQTRSGAAPVVLEEAVAEAVAEVVAEEVVEGLPGNLSVVEPVVEPVEGDDSGDETDGPLQRLNDAPSNVSPSTKSWTARHRGRAAAASPRIRRPITAVAPPRTPSTPI